jgi:hypothetical protein
MRVKLDDLEQFICLHPKDLLASPSGEPFLLPNLNDRALDAIALPSR